MLSFEQAKTEVCQQVLPEFIKTVTTFDSRESAKLPTVEFINKIAELLLHDKIPPNQPQELLNKQGETKQPDTMKTQTFAEQLYECAN